MFLPFIGDDLPSEFFVGEPGVALFPASFLDFPSPNEEKMLNMGDASCRLIAVGPRGFSMLSIRGQHEVGNSGKIR
jgi:hypothetical protein